MAASAIPAAIPVAPPPPTIEHPHEDEEPGVPFEPASPAGRPASPAPPFGDPAVPASGGDPPSDPQMPHTPA